MVSVGVGAGGQVQGTATGLGEVRLDDGAPVVLGVDAGVVDDAGEGLGGLRDEPEQAHEVADGGGWGRRAQEPGVDDALDGADELVAAGGVALAVGRGQA